MSNILNFEAKRPSDTRQEEILPPHQKRKTLLIQNNHETAIFYVSNSEHTELEACYKLKPGCELSSDLFTPTDAFFARSTVAGAALAVITGF